MKILYSALFFAIFSSSTLIAQSGYRGYPYGKSHSSHYKPHHNRSSFDQGSVTNDWILYGQNSLGSFGRLPVVNRYYGIGAQYYFADRWSIRGGIFISPEYTHVTPAPLSVLYFKLLASTTGSEGSHHYHHSGHGDGVIGALICLFINDGIGYDIYLGNHILLMPYFGSWQLEYSKNAPVPQNICAMGVSLKIEPVRNLLLITDAEYNRTPFFTDSKSGYHINFSLGYRLRSN